MRAIMHAPGCGRNAVADRRQHPCLAVSTMRLAAMPKGAMLLW